MASYRLKCVDRMRNPQTGRHEHWNDYWCRGQSVAGIDSSVLALLRQTPKSAGSLSLYDKLSKIVGGFVWI